MKRLLIVFVTIFISVKCSAQNIGIGTITPAKAKLEVSGVAGTGATSAVFGSDGSGISLQRNWPSIGFNQYRLNNTDPYGRYITNGYAALMYMNPNSGDFAIDMFPSGVAADIPIQGANRVLTILANGNMGIKFASPTYATLMVKKESAFLGSAVFQGTTHATHFHYSTTEDTYIRAGRNGSNVYLNKIPNGDVFFGDGGGLISINNPLVEPTATIEMVQPYLVPAIKLTDGYNYSWSHRIDGFNYNNTFGYQYVFLYGTNAKGRFQYWDGYYQVYSDASLKHNIKTLDPVLDKINQLKPVSYEMKNQNEGHERSMGFLAQEVKPLFPLLVRQIEDKSRKGEQVPDMHTMNYSGFGVLAVKALQEQQLQINSLEKETEELLQRLAELETIIDSRIK